jgi:hypothetical protein
LLHAMLNAPHLEELRCWDKIPLTLLENLPS